MKLKLIGLALASAFCAVSSLFAQSSERCYRTLAVCRPGLNYGHTDGNSNINKTTYPAMTNSVLSPVMAKTSHETGSSLWTQNRTEIYWGQIYLDGSTYRFGEHIFDKTFLRIGKDGTLYTIINGENYSNTEYGVVSTDSRANTPWYTGPGWYDFDVRFWWPSGRGGPQPDSNGFSYTKGFGYIKGEYDSVATVTVADWIFPEDPGDGSVFRVSEFTDETLLVVGDPADAGISSIPYGTNNCCTIGDSVTVTMVQPTIDDGEIYATLAGWKLCAIDRETLKHTQIASSEDVGAVIDSCTYTHGGLTELTWIWEGARFALKVEPPTFSEIGSNFASFSANVNGIGYTADEATVYIAYGQNADNLTYTNEVATVTSTRNVTVDGEILRLLPNQYYYAKMFIVADDEIAESETVFFETPKSFFTDENAGLNYGYIDGCNDIYKTTYPAMTNRVLSPVMAETKLETGSGWTARRTEIYWGQIYLDGSTYRFGEHIFDKTYLQIGKDGTLYTVINGMNYSNTEYGVVSTDSRANTPWYTGPGWYDFDVRFWWPSGRGGPQPDSNGFSYTKGFGYIKGEYDSVATVTVADWIFPEDPGDRSIFRRKADFFSAEEVVEGGTLSGVTIEVSAADFDRELFIAYGPREAEGAPEAWTHTNKVGVIEAGETTLSFDEIPANWGTDENLAMAFFTMIDSQSALFTKTIFWRDYGDVLLQPLSLNGVGGDTLTISSRIDSFTGSRCALSVFMGTDAQNLNMVWANVTNMTQCAEYTITLFESDPESERYIAPGETYFVAVEAVAGGKTARTPIAQITMLEAARFKSDATTGSRNRKTLTAQTSLEELGALARSSVVLYVGETNDPEEMTPAITNVVNEVGKAITLTHILPEFQKTYYWQLRAINQTQGGSAEFETRSGVGSITTADDTIYTWKPSVTEGDWNDPANWTDNYNGDSVGYPNSTAATATFADNTKAKIRFTTANAIGPANFTGGNMDLTFVQGGASTNATRLNITGAVAMNGANSRIVLDNVAMLIAPQVTLGGMTTLCLTNAANLRVNNNGAGILNEAGGTIEVVDESYLNVGPLTIGGGKILVRDAGIWVRDYVRVGSGLPGGTLRFEGTHPYLYASNAGQEFRAAIADAQFAIDFLVPEGGYASAPLKTINNSTKAFMVNSPSAVAINVLDESPANYAQETIETPLIAWNSGFNKDKVTLGNLPMGEVTDDEFVWGVDGAEKTIALGARIVGGSFAGRIEVGNSIALPADAEGIAPAKGIHEIPGAGMTCVAPSTIALEIGGTAMLKGYRIYRVETPSLKKTLIQSGVGNSATIAHTGDFLYLEWQWEAAFGVSAAANDAAMGEVRGAKAVKLGEIAVFEAVAKDGYGFSHWEVGGARYENYRDETLKLQVEGPIQVVGVFVPAVYATPTGAGDKSGSNWENALEGVAGIKAKLAADPNAFIYVADGLYEVRTDGIVLSGSATIAGVSENCGAIFKAMGGLSATSQNAVFRVSAANARIVRVAITTSSVNRSSVARGLYMNAVGFVDRCMITNCAMLTDGGAAWLTGNAVMRNCIFDYNTGGSKGPLLLQDALVENCEITRGSGSLGTVYMDGDAGAGNSIMRGCLVAYNTTVTDGSYAASGIKLQAGVVDSCTIVSNNTQHVNYGMALLIETKKPCTIRNTIIRGNFNKNAEKNYYFYTDTKRVSQNCCTYPAMTGMAMLDCDPVFKTSKDGNIFALDRKRSPLVNAGDASGYNGVVGPVDLSGNKRIVRGTIDIGAYEATPSSATMMVVE